MVRIPKDKQLQFITFQRDLAQKVLGYFDKAVDDKGFIVEKNTPHQRVLSIQGEEIKIEEFAGIRKGSEIFIKSDLGSLIEFAEKHVWSRSSKS